MRSTYKHNWAYINSEKAPWAGHINSKGNENNQSDWKHTGLNKNCFMEEKEVIFAEEMGGNGEDWLKKLSQVKGTLNKSL